MTDDRNSEERLRHRLRFVAGLTFVGLIVIQVLADVFTRLVLGRESGGGEIFFGTLVGALLALLGIEGLTRFPGGKP